MKKIVPIILLSFLLGCSYPVSNPAKNIGNKVNNTCKELSSDKTTKNKLCNAVSEAENLSSSVINLSVLERTVQILTW